MVEHVALARAAAAIPADGALPGPLRFEWKLDGWRALCVRRDGRATIWSRNGNDISRYLPDLVDALLDQVPDGYTLDAEAVAWDPDGHLDFEGLQRRLIVGKRLPATISTRPAHLAVFDLLELDGRDIRQQPLHARRALLEALAEPWYPPLQIVPQTADRSVAEEWFATMHEAGIEGLVIKGAAQPYEPGVRQWIKVKHRDTLDVVCGAVTGSLTRPGELVIGLPIGGALRIVGRTTSISQRAAKQIAPYLHPPRAGHPWPADIRATTLERFSTRKEPLHLALIEPFVIEISADIAWSGRAFRHAVRFVRPRPEMRPMDVESPRSPTS